MNKDKEINNKIMETCKKLIKKFKEDIESGKIKLNEKDKKEYKKIMKNINLDKK